MFGRYSSSPVQLPALLVGELVVVGCAGRGAPAVAGADLAPPTVDAGVGAVAEELERLAVRRRHRAESEHAAGCRAVARPPLGDGAHAVATHPAGHVHAGALPPATVVDEQVDVGRHARGGHHDHLCRAGGNARRRGAVGRWRGRCTAAGGDTPDAEGATGLRTDNAVDDEAAGALERRRSPVGDRTEHAVGRPGGEAGLAECRLQAAHRLPSGADAQRRRDAACCVDAVGRRCGAVEQDQPGRRRDHQERAGQPPPEHVSHRCLLLARRRL